MSGGTVRDLLAALRSVSECRALSVLEEALCRQDDDVTDEMSGEQMLTCWLSGHVTAASPQMSVHYISMTMTRLWFVSAGEAVCAQLQELKVDQRVDSGVCDSGVELSTA